MSAPLGISPLAERSAEISSRGLLAGTAEEGGTPPPESTRTAEEESVAGEHGAEELTCSEGYELERLEGTTRPVYRVRLGTLEVTLRERSRGTILLDLRGRGAGQRTSTGTHDWQEAVSIAEGRLRQMLDGRGEGPPPASRAAGDNGKEADEPGAPEHGDGGPGDPTRRNCVELFKKEKLPAIKKEEARNAILRAVALVDALWGLDIPAAAVDRKHVDDFIPIRTEEGVIFDDKMDRGPLEPVTPYTAREDLRAFNRIMRYAAARKLDGRTRFLEENPFETLRWPRGQKFTKDRRPPIPEGVHIMLLTPWTDPRTGVTLPPPVQRIDPSGGTGMAAQTAFGTGHRREAISNLRVGQLLFDLEDLRQVLIQCGGVHSPSWAEVFMPGGAFLWIEVTQKGKYERVTPMSRHLSRAFRRYLPTLPSLDPMAPVFPSPLDPTKPIGESTLLKTRSLRGDQLWKLRPGGYFTEAVFLVRAQMAVEGRDPNELIPLRIDEETGAVNLPWKFHGYRHLFATALAELGYTNTGLSDGDPDLDRHANFLGGWTIKTGGAKRTTTRSSTRGS